MKNYKLLIVGLILFTAIASAQVYTNPNLPRVTRPTANVVITSGSGGGNVTSVTSSTNCITVNPTTNDVILTFNTSCSGSVASFITNQINNNLNTTANITFNNLTLFDLVVQNIHGRGDINLQTDANGQISWTTPVIALDGVGGNSLDIIAGTSDMVNLGGQNNYFNTTWSNYFFGNGTQLIGLCLSNGSGCPSSSSFNSTYNAIIGQTCPIGQVVNGTLTNGTIKCQTVLTFLNNTNIVYLNNTQTFTGTNHFKNITTANITSSGWIDGVNFILRNVGASFFPSTSFQVTTQDVGSGLLTLPVIDMEGGAGVLTGAIRNGLYILPELNTLTAQILLSKNNNADDVWIIEDNNNTGAMQIYRINPFTTTKVLSMINATDVNITSNHQTYNTTNAIALDTTYTNTYERPILVSMDTESQIFDDNSVAYVTTYVNGSECSGKFGQNERTASGFGLDRILYGQVHCIVQPTLKYSFNTTISGTGVVKKGAVRTTVI